MPRGAFWERLGQGIMSGSAMFGQSLQDLRDKEEEKRKSDIVFDLSRAKTATEQAATEEEKIKALKTELGDQNLRLDVTKAMGSGPMSRVTFGQRFAGQMDKPAVKAQYETLPEEAKPLTEMDKLDLEKKRAEIDKLKKETGQPIDEKSKDNALQLQNKFVNLSGDFLKVRDAYQRISDVGQNPSAAGDLSLIFNYMKMLDPGSTVREGEFATAQNSAGVPDIMRAKYNKVMTGERLADTQRTDFLNQSKTLYGSMEKQQKALEDTYSTMAETYGIPAKFVVLSFRTFKENEKKNPLDKFITGGK